MADHNMAVIGDFAGKDVAFVCEWLDIHSLGKLADIFKGMMYTLKLLYLIKIFQTNYIFKFIFAYKMKHNLQTNYININSGFVAKVHEYI